MTLTRLELHSAAIKLIVYDLDGTLVDAFEDIWDGVNHALRRFGLPELSYETVKNYVGDGARMLIRRCLGESHAARFDEVYHAYRTYYAAHPVAKAHPYPGALETLDRLRGLGYRQAVLTNKPDEVSRQTCERLGVARRVDEIWGERPGSPRKPEAESLLRVVRHFGLIPAAAVLVGDGPADHKVATAAGVSMIAVTYGLLTRQQALALRPAAVLDKIEELTELLEG
jgi:phosphoglycolate phosphatase